MSNFNQEASIFNVKGSIQQHISLLLSLAHDRSEDGRVRLAEKLADVFFAETIVLTRREETLLNDFIDDLLKSEHESVRNALIERFAAKIDAPRTVALRMASSSIVVAQGVLRSNENLLDDDLITIIENKSVAHAHAIATRQAVSEAVSDALVETGDLRVMHIVAENLGARLSRHAIEILVESAKLSAMLQKPLLSRKEINAEQAVGLYWWTAKELRQTTMERFGFGPGRLETELSKAVDALLASHALQKEQNDAVAHLADWLVEREALKIDTLPQILRAGHYKLFALALSRISQLDLRVVNAILSEKGTPMMAALCRAVGIDKGKFISIFLMSRGARADEQVVNPRELSQALATFDRVSVEVARSMVQTWRVAPESVFARMGDETLSSKAVG